MYDFQISPDSSRVVYTADQETSDGVDELYSVPLAGGSVVKLNGPPVNGGEIYDFQISPDGSRVVYVADQETDGVNELYSVPLDGGSSAVKLNDPLVDGGDVNYRGFQISPDGSRVVYGADQETRGVYELYSVPLDGGSSPVKLNDPLVEGGNVFEYAQISPDSSRVVYIADQDTDNVDELYSVPLVGGSPVKLNGPLVDGGEIAFDAGVVASWGFRISPDSSRVVYVADQETDNVNELYSVPLAGGSAVKLNDPLVDGGAVDFQGVQISPDSSRVVYIADQDTDNVDELYSASLVGGGSPVKLNGPLVDGGEIALRIFQISPDSSRVVYLADQETDNVNELYSVPLAGDGSAVKLNGPLVGGGAVGEVAFWAFQISPDSSRVVYIADQETNDLDELYSVPLTGGNPVKFDNQFIVGDVADDFQISPDGERVVYIADQDMSRVYELYSVPLTGDGSPVKLNNPFLVEGGDVADFRISPDSSRVVYQADQETDEVVELYSVPLDGSSYPVKLNGPLVYRGDVYYRNFQISPDSSRVVYRADQETDEVFDLYSVPLAGAGSPVKLNGPLGEGGQVGPFQISPDSSRVIYIADQETRGVFELYSVPLDGSGSAVKLNGPLIDGRYLQSFQISPDSSRVVYRADQETKWVLDLYSVPLDGDGNPVKLNGPLVEGGDVIFNTIYGYKGYFQISPDSSRVVYIADQETNEVFELYSARLAGGGDPVKLNSPLVEGGDVVFDLYEGSFQISPDSSLVVYVADQEMDEVFELYVSYYKSFHSDRHTFRFPDFDYLKSDPQTCLNQVGQDQSCRAWAVFEKAFPNNDDLDLIQDARTGDYRFRKPAIQKYFEEDYNRIGQYSNCGGFAAVSLLRYLEIDDPAEHELLSSTAWIVPGEYEPPPDDDVKDYIHLYQTRLDSAAAWQWRIDRDDDAFHETYAAIKTELQQDRPVIIELRWGEDKVLNEYRLLAYQVEETGDTARLSVYDCRWPGNTPRQLDIDLAAPGWRYEPGSGAVWQGDQSGLFGLSYLPAEILAGGALPIGVKPNLTPAVAAAASPPLENYIIVRTAGQAETLITNSRQQSLGYRAGRLVSQIPAAGPMVPPGRPPQPVDRFLLPGGEVYTTTVQPLVAGGRYSLTVHLAGDVLTLTDVAVVDGQADSLVISPATITAIIHARGGTALCYDRAHQQAEITLADFGDCSPGKAAVYLPVITKKRDK